MNWKNFFSLVIILSIGIYLYLYKKSISLNGESYSGVIEIVDIQRGTCRMKYVCDSIEYEVYMSKPSLSMIGDCYEVKIQKNDCDRYDVVLENPVFRKGTITNLIKGEVYFHNEALNFIKYEYKLGDQLYESSQYILEGGTIDSLLENKNYKFMVEYDVNNPIYSRIKETNDDEILFLNPTDE